MSSEMKYNEISIYRTFYSKVILQEKLTNLNRFQEVSNSFLKIHQFKFISSKKQNYFLHFFRKLMFTVIDYFFCRNVLASNWYEATIKFN